MGLNVPESVQGINFMYVHASWSYRSASFCLRHSIITSRLAINMIDFPSIFTIKRATSQIFFYAFSFMVDSWSQLVPGLLFFALSLCNFLLTTRAFVIGHFWSKAVSNLLTWCHCPPKRTYCKDNLRFFNFLLPDNQLYKSFSFSPVLPPY